MGKIKCDRIISVITCSFLFTYLLTFVFEGKVFYSLLSHFGIEGNQYIIVSIIAHFIALFSCGFFVKSAKMARNVMCMGMFICLVATIPFYFRPSIFWLIGVVITGFAGGCAFASWGFFLKLCTPQNERIKSCADVLIISNVLMIVIDVISVNFSAIMGLVLAMLCLAAGMVFSHFLPAEKEEGCSRIDGKKITKELKKPLLLLFVFVAIITVNSGLMYQVINPAFSNLSFLVSWYWAVPYIIALVIMRNLSVKVKRSRILYIGMAMIMAAFVGFMLMGRDIADYIVIDTLMLGACGIFDLFWWSIIGEMLNYSDNPVKISGIGLSANVFGVLCGDIVGLKMESISLPSVQVTVIALCIVCVTLVILPPLNEQLVILLKNHVYLFSYLNMNQNQQREIIQHTKALDTLTGREGEVLELILSGKSNKDIALALSISENTVKTHTRNIFSKYDVSSRAELISILLRNQTGIS